MPRSPTNTTRSNWNRWFRDRKSTRLNSSHGYISYAVFCLKKKKIDHAAFYFDIVGIVVGADIGTLIAAATAARSHSHVAAQAEVSVLTNGVRIAVARGRIL